MGLSGETLVDLLEALGHALPHSSCKRSESFFLRSLRELGLWTQTRLRLPPPHPPPPPLLKPRPLELARMVSVPLLSVVSEVDSILSCPAKHAQCLLVSPPSPRFSFAPSGFL